jgi:hypothetical protein
LSFAGCLNAIDCSIPVGLGATIGIGNACDGEDAVTVGISAWSRRTGTSGEAVLLQCVGAFGLRDVGSPGRGGVAWLAQSSRGLQCTSDFSQIDHLSMASWPLDDVRAHFNAVPLATPML